MPTLAPSTLSRRRSPSPSVPSPPLRDDSPVTAQLDRIVHSSTFSRAHRSQLFLRYIVHHAQSHPGEQLKEYSIAIDVFDRDISYDPAVNNTVRVEAGRLRSRLLEYYSHEGHDDPLFFEVPKGSYRVRIHQREPIPSAAISGPELLRSAPVVSPLSPPAKPLGSSARQPLTRLWAVPLAFLIGAFVGYHASH